LLEALFHEALRRIEREAQILRDKLALPCNDTEREATKTAYNLVQADLAEVRASVRDFDIREERERAAVREMEERAALREMAVREMAERAALREMEERAALREMAVREMAERAALREMEERAALREMEERAALREMEERAALREQLRQNQQHETLLNFSKEVNQISNAILAVNENLSAASSEAERQRLESRLADLRRQHSFSLAQHEAYQKQGMATSL
jgi:hypothetical protein